MSDKLKCACCDKPTKKIALPARYYACENKACAEYNIAHELDRVEQALRIRIADLEAENAALKEARGKQSAPVYLVGDHFVHLEDIPSGELPAPPED